VDANAHNLSRLAREIFHAALPEVDAGRAVRAALLLNGARLTIVDSEFELSQFRRVCAIAIGKAGFKMAQALSDVLGARLTRGVASVTAHRGALPSSWQTFTGGHPLPNDESLAAGRAAQELLRACAAPDTLALFLISGGGSAMLERPRDERITLAELRTTNRVLVNCGAPISEINMVRAALSAIKGGGLSAAAPQAAQVSLLVSDTNPGALAQVASGPTYPPPHEQNLADLLERYQLRRQLPAAVLRALDNARALEHEAYHADARALRRHYLLLDNERARGAAARAAQAHGFVVEVCDDLIEAPVEAGCRELVARLLRLKANEAGAVCLVNGGEFVCPVRGTGTGGRNLEAALRCAVEFDAHADEITAASWRVAALHAGTDGIDGNSPAAGAIADETTIRRAHALGLDALDFLARSDAYNFFRALGDTIETGPTGTNVRDLRIMIGTKKQ
jgi:glycerate 2-kinase